MKDNEPGRRSLKNCESAGRFQDPIEIAFNKRISKNNYIAMALHPDQAINMIMKPAERKSFKFMA